jgi:hypothetical protein
VDREAPIRRERDPDDSKEEHGKPQACPREDRYHIPSLSRLLLNLLSPWKQSHATTLITIKKAGHWEKRSKFHEFARDQFNRTATGGNAFP